MGSAGFYGRLTTFWTHLKKRYEKCALFPDLQENKVPSSLTALLSHRLTLSHWKRVAENLEISLFFLGKCSKFSPAAHFFRRFV